jgi:hypothetical protein
LLISIERSLAPDVDVGEREDDDEEEELDEAEPRELVEDDGERIQEDDLDVEDDEEHRRQVEADREAAVHRRSVGDARLERQRAHRMRRCGLVASANDAKIIETGIASAKKP